MCIVSAGGPTGFHNATPQSTLTPPHQRGRRFTSKGLELGGRNWVNTWRYIWWLGAAGGSNVRDNANKKMG